MATLSNIDHHLDALMGIYEERGYRPSMVSSMAPRSSWPFPFDPGYGNYWETRDLPPRQRIHSEQLANSSHYSSSGTTLLSDWSLPQSDSPTHPSQSPQSPPASQQSQQLSQMPQFLHGNSTSGQFSAFAEGYHHQPQNDYIEMPPSESPYEPRLTVGNSYDNVTNAGESQVLRENWGSLHSQMTFTGHECLPSLSSRQSLGSDSSTSTYSEVISLPRSSNDNAWTTVEQFSDLEASFHQNSAVYHPGPSQHLRNDSGSSASDSTCHYLDSYTTTGPSYDEMAYPYSPISEGYLNFSKHRHYSQSDTPNIQSHSHSPVEHLSSSVSTLPVLTPISPPRILTPPSSSSPLCRLSPPSFPTPVSHNSISRKNTTNKVSKTGIRRASIVKAKKPNEKRGGRRRGPLLPEQRKQASEIRKLRACLRCKFLKKTCDKGEPCVGCQPSHARLWQVPCTRIDIKDIAYFMKDWRADHERLLGQEVSIYNILGFAQKEQLIWITHGYGFAIPIMAREVFVADESCLTVGWVESIHKQPLEFDMRTERISTGSKGISTEALSEYLDKHLEGPFETFLDEHFEGTPFITDILKTAHRYYVKEQVPVIRKALKLVLAYNLTLHVTLVEQYGEEPLMKGIVMNENSKYNGKIMAPAMINFQIRCALADMWRDLQKEVLVELSSLYSSVYSGDRLKNWPTIFMIASILLAVWEEMQFDSHYRVPDPIAVHKFCNDMETTPVGVIVGLFHAISQKLPSFTEWDTRRHGQLLNNNLAVCEAMTEMKFHVTKHENYLRTRLEAQFDSRNFDSLSNKFLSKLVIRAN